MRPDDRLLQEVRRRAPWYHDFSALGLQTVFPLGAPPLLHRLKNLGRRALGRPAHPHVLCRSHHFLINQRCKEPPIESFLRRALARLGDGPACADLFCADGYYSCLLKTIAPAARVTGVDLDGEELERARLAARALELDGVEFVRMDVRDFLAPAAAYDLVLCAGGLYHLADPADLIARLARATRRFALVQSVVTLDTEDPSYFVTPAPGWRHGSRFTHARLAGWLTGSGLAILDEKRNVLAGNRRASSRGSSYFLCAKTPEQG